MEWWQAILVGSAILVSLNVIVRAIADPSKWVAEVNNDRKSLKKAIKEIRRDVKKILSHLNLGTVVDNSSPLQLTEMGKEISQELNAKQWAEKVAPSLTAELADRSEYEIQEECFDYVRNMPLKETRSAVSIHACDPHASDIQASMLFRSAFHHGIDVDAVKDVLAIELRDKVFDLLGISFEDDEK